jgi:lipid II:glycine glycyltransferase (peptidoglycan interpeptide bridge formation enzyme)
MSWEQVKSTVRLIKADFFIVYSEKQLPLASAIVFQISKAVVQVIYWGDLQGYSELKPMNFISYKVFEYYKSSGKKVVDIGPSTEHSMPNYGLCEFKEGIGCRIDPKFTMIKKLS